MAGAFDPVSFATLQERLLPMWPTMTLRRRDEDRTLIVLSSVSVDVPPSIHPLLPAYEERYLIYVLGMLRAPNTHVIYVTSQPILPRMIDYYLGLIPDLDHDELRSRLVTVSVGDWTPRPLTQKILERPRVVERLRSLITDRTYSVLVPFMTTPLEARLALALDVPVYGPHPDLWALATKSGSRRLFERSGVALPRGTAGVRTVDDVVDALSALVDDPRPAQAVVKLDDSVSGFGNAIVDLAGATTPADLEARVRSLRPEDPSLGPEAFLAALASGGVVEERIAGTDFRSPSVQLRASPEGGVEVLSTHDQILGGPGGQTYFGCRFPADPAYAPAITRDAVAAGEALAEQGVIGRFGVDFVAVREPSGWRTYAVEVNLRNGGTTHPALTLETLTEGDYDAGRTTFTVGGVAKHYVATDHLEVPGLRSLTPDDVLDVVAGEGLGWDHGTRRGVVLHMISAVGVGGQVGLTAIADSPGGADQLYRRAEGALRRAVRG